ncbi:MAG: hypothetical protein LBN02_09185 [Oscillospiraceae bacterium]|jgi:hypothetical protein|nr:hypothetical protein [Oscillospiraceae bacterium]
MSEPKKRKRLSVPAIVALVLVGVIALYLGVWSAIVFPKMHAYKAGGDHGSYYVYTINPDFTNFAHKDANFVAFVRLTTTDTNYSLCLHPNLRTGALYDYWFDLDGEDFRLDSGWRTDPADMQSVADAHRADIQALFDEAHERWGVDLPTDIDNP